jgi:hypothetical protein
MQTTETPKQLDTTKDQLILALQSTIALCEQRITSQDQQIIGLQSLIEGHQKEIRLKDKEILVFEKINEIQTAVNTKQNEQIEDIQKNSNVTFAMLKEVVNANDKLMQDLKKANITLRVLKTTLLLGGTTLLLGVTSTALYMSYPSNNNVLPITYTTTPPSATLILPINSAIEKLNDLNNLEQSTEDIHPSWVTPIVEIEKSNQSHWLQYIKSSNTTDIALSMGF